jgi:integrase
VGEKPRDDYKDIRNDLIAIEERAMKIIEGLPAFSFSLFCKRFLDKNSNPANIFNSFDELDIKLKANGAVGNAAVYKQAKESLKAFLKKDVLEFSEITVQFLKDYERYMLDLKRSPTTISMYLRCVAKLYNDAIDTGDAKRENYPFATKPNDKEKYRVPNHRNIKKAIPIEDIGKIFHYKPMPGSPEHFYRDIWVFAYLCNGINMKDLCLLKYKDISGDLITFRRAKTIATKKINKQIVSFLNEEAKAIIGRWGLQPVDPKKHIFPVLQEDLDPEAQYKTIKQFTKQVNKYIRRIADTLELNIDITTQTARHSFASVLNRSGQPISFISDAMGHTSIKTTENYLDTLYSDDFKNISASLTNFKSPQTPHHETPTI